MSLKDYVADCGCVIEMNVTHDWESGTTDAEDISIITPCENHRPTPRAADGACAHEYYGVGQDDVKKCLSCGAILPRR